MTNKEAIEWLKSISKKYIHGGDEWYDEQRHEAINLAIKALDERPQGRWEFFSIGNNQYSRCSICKDEHTSEYTDLDWWYENFKYCPKCGARMIKGGAV